MGSSRTVSSDIIHAYSACGIRRLPLEHLCQVHIFFFVEIVELIP